MEDHAERRKKKKRKMEQSMCDDSCVWLPFLDPASLDVNDERQVS